MSFIKKFICKYFGHKEKLRTIYLKPGEYKWKYDRFDFFCTRCGNARDIHYFNTNSMK